MACQCEIFEICPECATTPLQYETAVKAHDDVVRQVQPLPKSYTLTELEQLAWQYADGSDASSNPWSSDAIRYRLYLGVFIAWLQQREREGGE